MSAPKPRIAVIGGTGALGSALASRLTEAGFAVTVGSRDPAGRAAHRAVGDPPVRTNAEAAEASDIVFLAVPWAVHAGILDEIAPRLPGRTIVDATVPIEGRFTGEVRIAHGRSVALATKERAGPGAEVVAALHTVAARTIAAPAAGTPIETIAFADRAEPLATVARVFAAIGISTWHGGGLSNAVAAEAMAQVLVEINRRHRLADARLRIDGAARVGVAGTEPKA